MDRPLPEAARAARRALRRLIRVVVAALVVLATAAAGGRAAGLDPVTPRAGGHYVNSALGFAVALPRDMAACTLPVERWREGVVLLPGASSSCAALDRLIAVITVSGEPNTEALGDVESLAASLCVHPSWGAVRVEPARRAIAGLPTLSCVIPEESATVTIEVMAQRPGRGPAATWTNLRVTLLVRGDRWLEYTRLLDDVVERVVLLPQ